MSRHSHANKHWESAEPVEVPSLTGEDIILVESLGARTVKVTVSISEYAYELYDYRADPKERAIDFYHRVYRSKRALFKAKIYASDVMKNDPKLYRTLSAYQTRHGKSLHDLFPPAPGTRRIRSMSARELAQWALEQSERRRKNGRELRARRKEQTPSPK